MSTPEQYGAQMRATLLTQVGNFFSNTQRGPGFCLVCTSPVTGDMCRECSDHRRQYGNQLADQALPLAYVRAQHPKGYYRQSTHHMWQYKDSVRPSASCSEDLQLMILGATYIHGRCIARRTGGLWQTVTFVPSRTRPGPEHPVANLARSVAEYQGVDAQRILLDPGLSNHVDKRLVIPDRFAVRGDFMPYVRGRHVLVVDDSWVSGGSTQSAALTLKAAGASAVTILCAARWLSYTWTPEQAAYVETDVVPYDAACCPVTGGACPT